MYYLFLRKIKPLRGKLNNLQKITYLCIPILIQLIRYLWGFRYRRFNGEAVGALPPLRT